MNEQRPEPDETEEDKGWHAETARFAWPVPGGRRNASAIPMSETALLALLAGAQMAWHAFPCGLPDCENCNTNRLVWWDTCNALSRSNRVALQAWLIAEGHGLPDAPWEDIEPDGTPVPRDFVQ